MNGNTGVNLICVPDGALEDDEEEPAPGLPALEGLPPVGLLPLEEDGFDADTNVLLPASTLRKGK